MSIFGQVPVACITVNRRMISVLIRIPAAEPVSVKPMHPYLVSVKPVLHAHNPVEES